MDEVTSYQLFLIRVALENEAARKKRLAASRKTAGDDHREFREQLRQQARDTLALVRRFEER